MDFRRSTASYSAIADEMNTKIEAATQTLVLLGYVSASVTAKEFYNYMTGETPTGDKTTLEDVLESEFLTVHEVAEISELKKMNIPINQRTVMNFYPKVYEAHFTAMDLELTCALNKADYEWLRRRFVSSEAFLSQLDDPYLGQEFDYLRKELGPKCRAIARKFSRFLSKL